MSEFVKETSEYVEMSDSITLCIVKDGAAGTSINMKTGVSSTDGLPCSGMNTGDSYIIDGHLWTYTGTTVSDATHHNGFTDCGKVSGEAGKNNYVHVAWSNTQNPTKDDVVLSNTDGKAYAYMGTWVSETKEDTADEAVNMATWVYVKGDKGDTPTIAKLRVDHSALHYNPTTKTWDYDSVTVSIVIFTPEGTKTPANGDTTEYYWTLDNDTYHRSSGDGFSATLEVASHTATLYKVGSNVPLDTITVPMVRDGEKGDSSTGAAATVYTIEPCANFEATGKLTDASHVTVSISGDVQVYKTIGDQKKLCGSGDGVYAEYFRLSIGGTNYDGKNTFTYDGGNIKVSKKIPYEVDKDKNNVPGSATITLYDLISGGTVGNQLASLVVPVSLNPGAIVDVNKELGTIQNTTTSMQNDMGDMRGTIETIKQGQGQINLKVQSLQSMAKSRNLISGGNVTGLYVKKYYVWDSSAFMMEQGKTYTVTACLWMDSATYNNHIKGYVIGADNNWTYTYASKEYTNTSSSIIRFKFDAGSTKQMIVRFYERNSSGKDPGIYNGVHIDWLRVDEGDWTGTGDNGKTLDAWTPAEEEIDALNLLPDPDFSEVIGYSDYMGERNSYINKMGDAVSDMSKDGTTVDGCHGIIFERSGATANMYAGLRYIVPFRGAGTYRLSYFVKDLHQTDASKPAWDEKYGVCMECHPMDASKTRITGGMFCVAQVDSTRLGDACLTASYTFGSTAIRNSTSNEVEIAYLEVRVYLLKNGSVRVSRLCLSKSDHFIYWNVNEVSEARKKDAAQLATGIDIYSHKILITSDNVKVRNNKGEETTAVDAQGNLTAGSLTCKDKVSGTVMSIMNGFFSALKGKAGVSLGVDKNGYPCLMGTDPNGNVLWRLGQTYETADQDSKVTMEVVSMKAYGQMNSYAIGEGVILTLNVTNNTNSAITINTSNMHMVLRSEFGTYRGNVDVAINISVGATAQVVLRGTEAIDTSSSSSTYTSPVGRTVTAVVVYQGDMRLTQDAEYQYQEGLRKDSDGNVQYTLPLM